jgi:signal peptidase I
MKRRDAGTWAALAFAVGILYLFGVKEIKFYLVPSESMEPILKKSDYIGGFAIEPSDLARGDIVIFTERDEKDYYVKRVVGLPGEKLQVFFGVVYIDGRKLEEAYVPNHGLDNFGPIKIPEGHVFLMGDNRTNSTDSRKLGPVPVKKIVAKASFIYSPVSRIGRIQ